jgi:hypothetical protein
MKTKLCIFSFLLIVLAGLIIFLKLEQTGQAKHPADSLPNQRQRSTRHSSQSHDAPTVTAAATRPGLAASAPSSQETLALRAAVNIRKALRQESERVAELTGGIPLALPAANVDLGDASLLQSEEHKSDIQKIAEDFHQKIANSGLDPASSEYRKFWNDAVRDSDQLFRARYGEQAWQAHHIHAHHLANSESSKK